MRFNITRLCGGKALMASPSETFDFDLDKSSEILKDEFEIKRNEGGLMLVMSWKEMEVTLYPQGKIMFYPLSEKELAVEYATLILEKLRE